MPGDSKSPPRISLVSRSLRKRSGESLEQELSVLKNELKRVKEILNTIQKEKDDMREEIKRLEQRWRPHEDVCCIRDEARQAQVRYLGRFTLEFTFRTVNNTSTITTACQSSIQNQGHDGTRRLMIKGLPLPREASLISGTRGFFAEVPHRCNNNPQELVFTCSGSL